MMTRITKDPEERRNEILETAMELFLTKGFEETAISDIVKKIGVAQGTFYYYFSSKDEILNAILDLYIEKFFQAADSIAAIREINAREKLQAIIDAMYEHFWYGTRGNMVEYMHTEKNELLHARAVKKFVTRVIPLLTRIVRQGRDEKIFNTPYPEEAMEIYIAGFEAFIHKYLVLVNDLESVNIKMKAAEDVLERLLGAEKGSFRLTIETGDGSNGEGESAI